MSVAETISFTPVQLTINWSDGSISELASIWLRDHCQMPTSRDPHSGQRLLNITEIDPNIEIASASLENGTVQVQFSSDGHHSTFSTRWLFENCYCLNTQYDSRSERSKLLWTAESFNKGRPNYRYKEFCADPDTKLSALQAVHDYGFTILSDVPCINGQVLKVIEKFGFVRNTNYGPLFEVRTEVNANNLAYTNLGLGCHLDNPYRDPLPSIQLLHCLQSSTEGGESILQDAFTAADTLRTEEPTHFDLLSQQYINFRFEDTKADLHSRVPMIEVNDRAEVIKVRFNNRSISTLKLPPENVRPFYKAYRHFAEILERKHLQIHFKLQPGELMLFDNTRILHARTAYSAGGLRHLQGAYSDLDGLYSTLSVLQRQQSSIR